MSRKRNSIEIYAAILKAARNGARKSHIVYKANLNFKIVKSYLDHLRQSGLISGPDNQNRVFRTTNKGIEYLDYFEGFSNYMNLETFNSYMAPI